MLIAGEASGDKLGARLMNSIRKRCPNVIFVGIGGPLMEREGLESLFPIDEISVMGIFEILTHVPRLLKRISQTVHYAQSENLDALITIDIPDFSFRVLQKLQGKGITLIHYVAPSVWAWRSYRAKKLARLVDHLLVILPFEASYFRKCRLDTTFVGHSVIEECYRGSAERFRKKYNISYDIPILSVLPGSRESEVKYLLPVFQRVVARIIEEHKDTCIVIPTTSTVRHKVTNEVLNWPSSPIVLEDSQDRYDAFAASRCALAASGTVSLELAVSGIPHMIAYRVNRLTAFIAKMLLYTDTITIINLVLKKKIIPEFIQDNCISAKIAPVLSSMMLAGPERSIQIAGFKEIIRCLRAGEKNPSDKAAETILKII